ncbi:MAG: PrsW family glutamic-type intramembrane protease [Bacteroidota bacterium]|nr:PrsW family glutamic-type intramembrane protease [Candidatus Kapabacteria bacterium]MCS7303441.1 PrsW family glutamic-type intramembrane protease [Candidatus Kapabacteria bacterium]MCX7937176.1 PrsW family glutamic-type intramembrane protease [Chlorobiota bacterium]MDW8075253.1 PrsW family glutamic-type intramembrane protease [Bacteroidota bacterium]MDW8271866.1 PrsW family glutamic-type intramembrane protease [Bacteroidota bacterium]
MEWWLVLLAIAPGVTIAGVIWWLDHYNREPHDLLIGCFLWGAVATVPVGLLQLLLSSLVPSGENDLLGVAIHAFVVIALLEEFAKYVIVRTYVFGRPDFDEPYDGITYTVMVAMGFATLENVVYVFSSDNDMQVAVALLRMITAVPAHGTDAVVMGYFLGLAKFTSHRWRYQVVGVGAAVLLHGLYDGFLFYGEPTLMVGGAAGVLALSVWLSVRAIRLHRLLSPFRSQD